jgi:hypothetical protein
LGKKSCEVFPVLVLESLVENDPLRHPIETEDTEIFSQIAPRHQEPTLGECRQGKGANDPFAFESLFSAVAEGCKTAPSERSPK